MASEGRYTRIKSRFWDDEKVILWNDDTKLLALYLMTCKHNNILGCYVIPKYYIAADLRWQDKRLSKPFAKLLVDGFIQYDDDYNLLFITNYIAHNPIDNINMVKSAQKKLAELPSSLILTGLKLSLERFMEQFDKPYHSPLIEQLEEQLLKQFGEGYQEQYSKRYGNSVTVSVTVYRNRIYNGNPSSNSSPPKKFYGEFVQLTDEEYQKLVEANGKEKTDGMIEILNNAIGAKGYKYKSHYYVMKKDGWVYQEYDKRHQLGSIDQKLKLLEMM
jgi:hypothetical protein